MEKILVPYKLALALREIGFNEIRPTYEEAFRWFNQKKIKFYITDNCSDVGVYHKVIFPDMDMKEVTYDDYDDAKNACIKQLIEILKTTNNEQQ